MKEKRKKKIKKEMEEKTKEKQVQKEIKIEDIKKRNKQDKNIQQNGWYVRYVTRPISLPLTKLFISFHPNTITIFMILIGLFSIPFFLNGGYLSIIIGAIILQIHLVFDSVDGNVARITNKRTWAGKYLDFLSNITVYPLVLIALGGGIFRVTGNLDYLLLGFSAGFFHLAKEPLRLFKYLMFDKLKIKKKFYSSKPAEQISLLTRLNKHSAQILEFPGIMNLILIFGILGIPHVLLIVYGILFPIRFVLRASYEVYTLKKREEKWNKKD